jgi:hydrogenase nickel incorporation protein HypA/HybF
LRLVHELSICSAIASIATEHAAGRAVSAVHLRVGHLRQVVPETLVYSWDLVVDGTALAGSVLDIEHVPAVIVCRDCGARSTLTAPITEGEEKPLKYPVMFRSADVVVVNKVDLLPYLDVDMDRFEKNLRDVHPDARTIQTSAKTGDGVDDVCAWLSSVARG